MWLYAALLSGSFIIPFVLSFDRKLQFYKQWKYVLPSIITVALFYMVFDIFFTAKGVWGFNPGYHSSVYFFDLPLEEVLFFIVIPYACIFLHESFILYFPGIKLNTTTGRIVTAIVIFFLILMISINLNKIYTVYSGSLMIIALILSFLDKSFLINRFYITFLVILVPFLLVNGILTGSFIKQEVVWYNDQENLGIRIFTIPFEDFGYAFSLILFNLLLISKLKGLYPKTKHTSF